MMILLLRIAVGLFVALHQTVAEDPEVHLDSAGIIRRWGYPVEEIDVTTDDGYILTMHRIPHGRNETKEWDCRPAVLLMHGLFGSSANFLMNLPSQSAAFVFADAGFDVFLPNTRGNTYGKRHRTLSPRDSRFWQFTWDEMAAYDLPASVDKILEVTNQSHVYLVGYSQGNLLGFTKLASDPAYGSKIRALFALAPIGTATHSKSVFRSAAMFGEFFLRLMGPSEILLQQDIMPAYTSFCQNPLLSFLCNDHSMIHGPINRKNYNSSRAHIYQILANDGASSWNLRHWTQMMERGEVAHFDYGSDYDNFRHYGTVSPPLYDYSNIVYTPIHLFYSDNDYLADSQDVEDYLMKRLSKARHVRAAKIPRYNHLDFIIGLDAADKLYRPIIKIIRKYDGC